MEEANYLVIKVIATFRVTIFVSPIGTYDIYRIATKIEAELMIQDQKLERLAETSLVSNITNDIIWCRCSYLNEQ